MTAEDMKAWPDVKVKLGKALNEKDMKGKTETELTLMRNSIFAQAGMEFTEPWVKNYFASRKWYKPGGFNSEMLSATDHANAHDIVKYQKNNNLLSFKGANARAVAADDKPTTYRGKVLHDRIIRMRYCDLISAGDYLYTLTFHRNGKADAEMVGENSPYGYGAGNTRGRPSPGVDKEGDNYGPYGPYGPYGGRSKASEGTWTVGNNDGFVKLTIDGRVTKLYFGTRSYYAHKCYDTPNGFE